MIKTTYIRVDWEQYPGSSAHVTVGKSVGGLQSSEKRVEFRLSCTWYRGKRIGTKIYNRELYRTSGTPGEQALACPKSMFQHCEVKFLCRWILIQVEER